MLRTYVLCVMRALRHCKCIKASTSLLWKHAYSNLLKISPPKTESFQIKIVIFYISAQNIDYGYSLEPPRRGG